MAKSKRKATCGRCGIGFLPEKHRRYTSLCPMCLVPHMMMSQTREGWCCGYCGVKASTMTALQNIECTYVYTPCVYCHKAPYCDVDCPAMPKMPEVQIGF